VDLVLGPDQEVLKEKSRNRLRRTPKEKESHQEEHLLIEEQPEGHLIEEDLLHEDLRNVEGLQKEGLSDDHLAEDLHLIGDVLPEEHPQEEHPQERNHQDVADVLPLHHVLGLLLDHLRKNQNRPLNYV
jgi:hypothetical protein